MIYYYVLILKIYVCRPFATNAYLKLARFSLKQKRYNYTALFGLTQTTFIHNIVFGNKQSEKFKNSVLTQVTLLWIRIVVQGTSIKSTFISALLSSYPESVSSK